MKEEGRKKKEEEEEEEQDGVVFQHNTKPLTWSFKLVSVRSIRGFCKIFGQSYYEPLLCFMILFNFW